jgi:ribonuclease HI
VDATPGVLGSGHAGVAAVIRTPGGAILHWQHGILPAHTSNAAEYQAVIFGLQVVLGTYGSVALRCLSDSRVVVDQLSGRAAVRAPGLIPLHTQTATLLGRFPSVVFVHIPRELNRLADALAWEALLGAPLRRMCREG